MGQLYDPEDMRWTRSASRMTAEKAEKPLEKEAEKAEAEVAELEKVEAEAERAELEKVVAKAEKVEAMNAEAVKAKAKAKAEAVAGKPAAGGTSYGVVKPERPDWETMKKLEKIVEMRRNRKR